MYAEVLVRSEGKLFRIDLHVDETMSADAARDWLDSQVVQFGCEPLRASGKLLRADKVLVVARDAGTQHFEDTAWAKAFAAASVALLDRTVIEIDVDALAVTY